MTLTVGSLFSGIGGIDLGLERAGMKVLWQVEIDEWCQRVLAKHWPRVDRFADVRDVGAHNLHLVDLIAGGFPCQDISIAGRAAGIRGERSGLWSEFARIIGDLRPRYVLVENVTALLHRGVDVVLGDLAALGYDAEWDCIPAAAVGAPHLRDRIWIVASRPEQRRSLAYTDHGRSRRALQAGRDAAGNGRASLAHSNGGRLKEFRVTESTGQQSSHGRVADRRSQVRQLDDSTLADTPRVRGRRSRQRALDGGSGRGGSVGLRTDPQAFPYLADASEPVGRGSAWPGRGSAIAGDAAAEHDGRRIAIDGHWRVEPAVGRVAHGVPARVDRLRGLGNAVVPQVVEWIGRRIVEAEARLVEQ